MAFVSIILATGWAWADNNAAFDVTAEVVNLRPRAGTITPPSGSSEVGAEEVFTVTATDRNGYGDIAAIHFTLGYTEGGSDRQLWVYYDSRNNRLWLRNAAGTDWIKGTLGTSGIIEDPRVKIDCSKCDSYPDPNDPNQNTLTLKLAITFKDAFPKDVLNRYLYIYDRARLGSGWKRRGTWQVGVNLRPRAGTITPPSGSSAVGAERVFTVTATDGNGYSDIRAIHFTLGYTEGGSGRRLWVYYDARYNRLWLRNAAGTDWIKGTLGTSGIIEDPRVKIDCSKCDSYPDPNDPNQNTLTLELAITFKDAFPKATLNRYLYIYDRKLLGSGWKRRGTWQVGVNFRPRAGTITPPSGSSAVGAERVFTVTATDGNGYSDIRAIHFTLGYTEGGSGRRLWVYYDAGSKILRLRNAAGTDWIKGTLGTSDIIEDSHVKIDCSKCDSYPDPNDPNQNTLTLELAVTFKEAFPKDVLNRYLYIYDRARLGSGWKTRGTWEIWRETVPLVINPNGGEVIGDSHDIEWIKPYDPDHAESDLKYEIDYTLSASNPVMTESHDFTVANGLLQDDGINNIYFYDTTKDTDGGAWREGNISKLGTHALSFNGVDDYVDCGGGGFPTIIDTFTMEFWINPLATRNTTSESNSGISGTSGQRYAIYPDQGTNHYGSGHAGIGVSAGTNGISVFEHAASHLPSLLVYDTNLSGWNHIVVICQDKQLELYLNGLHVKTGVTSTKIVHPSNERFGGHSYGWFKGFLDEIAIYDKALSEEEILERYNQGQGQELAGSEQGLIALYHFDEGSGATALDSSPNGNNGTIYGATYIDKASWYHEPSSSTRGEKNEFPEKAYLIASNLGLDIIDAGDNSMWMRFNKGDNFALDDDGGDHSYNIFAFNGVIYMGMRVSGGDSDGLHYFDFCDDNVKLIQKSGIHQRDTSSIAQRNERGNHSIIDNTGIIGDHVNDVHAAVVDGKTFIAVATNSGISVISEDSREVFDITEIESDWFEKNVYISDDGTLYFTNENSSSPAQADYRAGVYAYYNIGTLSSDITMTDSNLIMYKSDNSQSEYNPPMTYSGKLLNAVDTFNDLYVSTGTSTANPGDNTIFVATDAGLSVIQEWQGNELEGASFHYGYEETSNTEINYKILAGNTDKATSITVVDNRMWVGTDDDAGGGAVSEVDLDINNLTVNYTAFTSPPITDNSVNSLSAAGDILLVGTDVGATSILRKSHWNNIVSIEDGITTSNGFGSYPWATADLPESTDCKVRIRAYNTEDFTDYDESDDVFTIEHGPPGIPNIAIDEGDFTGNPLIHLTLSCENVSEMIIDENSDFSGSEWELYKTEKEFTLSAGDGEKRVYVKFKDNLGAQTDVASDTIVLDTTAPAIPADLNATAFEADVDLTWLANAESDLAGYNIYRSTVQGMGYFKINTQLLTQNSYQDTDFPRITTYYYVVTSVDNAGNESSYSDEASAIPVGQIVSGPLTIDNTWSDTIYITGDVTVPEGITLTILSGTQVIFAALQDDQASGEDTSRCELIIQGSLIAEGEESDLITFTSNSSSPQKNDWRGIIADISGSTEVFRVRYAVIEYSKYGIYAVFRSDDHAPIISNNTIRHITDKGIYCYSDHASLAITIENNTVFDVTTSDGIYCGSGYCSPTITIENNTVHHANKGIRCYVEYETSTVKIAHNTIYNNNSCGIHTYVYTRYGDPRGAFNLSIIDNQVYSNSNDGIHCAKGDYEALLITNNTIYDNAGDGIETYATLTLIHNSIYNNHDCGVKARGGGVDTINYNNLYDNTNYDLTNYNSPAQNARYNYWGDATTQEMDQGDNPKDITKIHDFYDDSRYGVVDYSNYLQSSQAFTEAPLSHITKPEPNSTITQSSYTIEGVASSKYGIKKVEVSTDNGATWNDATGANTFTYQWTIPGDGTYNLLSRAQDQNDVVETPQPAITITVDTSLPTTSGTLQEDETWQGTICITGDVTVPEGITLTILSGTQVIFAALQDDQASGEDTSRCELIIQGSLIAEGEESDLITFTSNSSSPQKNDWRGIIADISGSTEVFRVRYAVIEYSKYGIYAVFRSDDHAPIISNNTIRHITDKGIYCYSDHASLAITIENNTVFDVTTSDGIYCGSGYCSPTITIENNTVHHANKGIRCYVEYETSTVKIAHNTIYNNNSCGIHTYVYTRYGDPRGAFNLSIIDNHVYSNSNDGIHCAKGDYEALLITNNTIYDNAGDGIESHATPTLLHNNIYNNRDNGIRANVNKNSKVNYNYMYNNNNYDFQTLPGNAGDIIDATNNWWGTTDEQLIQQHIYDHADNPSHPTLNIYPYVGKTTNVLDLYSGTNIVSIPVVLEDMSPSNVYNELLEPDRLTNNLHKWDALTQSWIVYTGSDEEFGDITLGAAYRIDITEGAAINWQGWINVRDLEVQLDYTGKNLFGTPATRDIPIHFCKIKNTATDEVKPLQEAATAGWIESAIECWDASQQTSQFIDLTGDLTNVGFETKKGYWITTLIENLVLMLPADVPEMLDVTVTPDPFSPDEDFINDTTTIQATASDICYPRALIYDAADNFINELFLSPREDNPNISEVLWLGRDSSGAYVKNGTYAIYIDPGSALKRFSTTVQTNKYPTITNFSATPNPFSPNGDEVDDTTSISFNISEDAKLSLKIYDGLDNLVKTIVDNETAPEGAYNYIWDGTDDSDSPVYEGRYVARIEAQAAIGGEINSVSLNVYVTHITNISITVGQFNPEGGGTTDIEYTLTADALLTIRIYDMNDDLVRTLIDNQARTPGTYSEEWNGKDDSGNIVPDGVYYLIVEDSISGSPGIVYDPRGTGGRDVSHSISLSCSPFDTTKNTPCIITYDMPQAASINIKVRAKRFTGPAIKVIEYQTPRSAGTHQSVWDGKDEFGQPIQFKQYTFAIWGYTLVDNAIIVEGKRPRIGDTISLDPVILNPSDNPYSSEAKTATISYSLSRDCDVTIKIYDQYNNLVKTLLSNQPRNSSLNSEVWNIRNYNDVLVPQGEYRIDIQAKNGDNYSDIRSAAVFVYY